MINPGVISLASLNHTENVKFPYRFEIEDNIGEAIHIHYKDIRLDLTVKEFEKLADDIKFIIDDIVSVKGFSVSDFDPVVLVGIAGTLPWLKNIVVETIHLEDILVDTFDTEGNPILASLPHSRVFKALNGLVAENNRHTVQLNHFCKGTVRVMTNQERVLFNLQQIKEKGYPVGNNLIGIDDRNCIWDGQHRASALYYLYGNIEIPVRRLCYGDTDEQKRIRCRSIWEEEYKLLLKEKKEQIEKKEELKGQLDVLKSFIKRIVWTTWHKTNTTHNETRERLITIENKLNDIQHKLERK